MPLIQEKHRILVWTAALLFAGFFVAGMFSYRIARTALERGITEQQLPLAGEAIHAAIVAELQRPTAAAAMLAGDRFVRDWLLEGEADNSALLRYLVAFRDRHDARSLVLVSERTRRHYSADGIGDVVQEGREQDAWFFHARESSSPFIIAVAPGSSARSAPIIFVNYRMQDTNGGFLGVARVGLRATALPPLIDSHRRRSRRLHLVDAQRNLILADAPATIDTRPGLRDIAAELLHRDAQPRQLHYRRNDGTMFVSSRFMPETGWHLLVEQDAEDAAGPARRAFALNMAIGAAVAVTVIVLLRLTMKDYQTRLDRMAGSDMLTGLLNRQAFEIVFRQAMLDGDRAGKPLAGILFDIDFFRQVNEGHGQAAGDDVLRTVTRIAKGMLRESDIITRWGGEEFVVLLRDCTVEQAVAVAEKIRQEVDHHDFSAVAPDRHITISLGVAQRAPTETATMLFDRLDEALFKAKANGRNRLQVARSASGGNAATTA